MQHATAIAELESTIRHASPDKRLETLRAITKLFLENAANLGEDKVDVFDNVFDSLLNNIEITSLTELSESLAPVENAPRKVIKRLANDAEITVANPVLTQSPRLTADDLVQVAETKGQAHLMAISRRAQLPEPATDILIKRGDREVIHNLARNPSARFSNAGLDTLFDRAAQDNRIAAALSTRPDIPPGVLRDSLAKAVERLESQSRSFAAAQRLVITMKQEGQLGDEALHHFAAQNRRNEVVAALSVLSGLKHELIDTLVDADEPGGLLIVCRALGITWHPISAILKMRCGEQGLAPERLLRTHADFGNLSKPTAERVLRFWQVRQRLANGPQA
jgi:uncharacterized protein (DUF2336 family)